jgi:hypothetical protein
MTPERRQLDGQPGASDNSVMTAPHSYLPFSLDPLMAEAKRRARQRRVLLSAVGLVGVASAVALFLVFGGGGTSNGQGKEAAGTRGSASPAVGLTSLAAQRPVYFIHGFGGIRKPPGGAALRHKHKIAQSTALGAAAIWVAPDWAVRGSCAWLTIGRIVDGGECRRFPPPRGLWEVVPIRLRVEAQSLTLLWGHAGNDVASLTVRFQDGTATRLPRTGGVFFHVFPKQRWIVGHRPAWLVARGSDGQVLRVRLITNSKFAGPATATTTTG